MDDPTPVAVEARDDDHGRYRWHLTDAGGVSVRVSSETYATHEDAIEAGQAALDAFGAAARS